MKKKKKRGIEESRKSSYLLYYFKLSEFLNIYISGLQTKWELYERDH